MCIRDRSYITNNYLGNTMVTYIQELFWTPNETIMLAIGQSITQVSPIAVARYVSAIANGGTVYDAQDVYKRQPVAAALGAGVPIEDERGCMMIVIGGSTTEVSVLSMNGIAAARATRTGGLALDEAIMRYVRREKGLIIGQRTAEDLKLDLGTARDIAMLDNEEASLRGRDARTGKPSTVGITARDIRNAIMPPMEALLESIREAFENTPAEMAEDILQRGVFLLSLIHI